MAGRQWRSRGTSEITVQATADQMLVVLDEAAPGLAEGEVVRRDAEDERLDEAEDAQAVVAVGTEAVGDVAQLAGEVGDAGERVPDRRLRVRGRERAGELEPSGEGHALVERAPRL